MNINYILTCKLIIFISLISFGCDTKNQNNIIPPHKLAEIYIDLNLDTGIELFRDTLYSNDVSNSLIDSILKKHNYNRSDMLQTIENYNNEPLKWKEFYKIVITRLEKMNFNTD